MESPGLDLWNNLTCAIRCIQVHETQRLAHRDSMNTVARGQPHPGTGRNWADTGPPFQSFVKSVCKDDIEVKIMIHGIDFKKSPAVA